MLNPWIRTYSGINFHPFSPNDIEISFNDIAHALSNICRFCGHTSEFYSVAQHSVMASRLASKENALFALLHDAAEAYICDLSSPIKNTPDFENFRILEDTILSAILKMVGLKLPMPTEIKYIDAILLKTEARDLLMCGPDVQFGPDSAPFLEDRITPWSPKVAKQAFISRFLALAPEL